MNLNEFLKRYNSNKQINDELLELGFGCHDFSVYDEDYSDESGEDEEFRDTLCDLFEPRKMNVGEVSVKGNAIHCTCIHEIRGEYGGDPAFLKYFIVEFQCDTILLAVFTIWDEEHDCVSDEYQKIITTEGVHNVSETGYLEEMLEDLNY